jgi:hypothetical protein
MANCVAWSVPAEVDVRRNDATTIATHDLHCDASSPLQTATNIATVPSKTKRDLWVDAYSVC